ncbi:hypothetical protein T12_9869 [Trichinella patagoniensis]|uniref:Uncharacterized protein n=1 Tax=Trichinella patagoniensis TaxID=990121 RepID=A0A0V0ZCF2_9BILA|nr:hypothetical protein T12_9869 [Trichinella patagoniensis]
MSTNHFWRERKETTRANFRRNAERHHHASIKVAVAVGSHQKSNVKSFHGLQFDCLLVQTG